MFSPPAVSSTISPIMKEELNKFKRDDGVSGFHRNSNLSVSLLIWRLR